MGVLGDTSRPSVGSAPVTVPAEASGRSGPGLVITLVNPAFTSRRSALPVALPTSPLGIFAFAGPVMISMSTVLSPAASSPPRGLVSPVWRPVKRSHESHAWQRDDGVAQYVSASPDRTPARPDLGGNRSREADDEQRSQSRTPTGVCRWPAVRDGGPGPVVGVATVRGRRRGSGARCRRARRGSGTPERTAMRSASSVPHSGTGPWGPSGASTEDRVDVAREAGIKGAGSCRRLGYVLVADAQRRVAGERRLPEEELDKAGSPPEEIAGGRRSDPGLVPVTCSEANPSPWRSGSRWPTRPRSSARSASRRLTRPL